MYVAHLVFIRNLSTSLFLTPYSPLIILQVTLRGFVPYAPPPVSAVATSIPAMCRSDNGAIYVNATGGVGGYTYLVVVGGSNPTWSGNYVNVPAGDYYVTAIDSNGCSAGSLEVCFQLFHTHNHNNMTEHATIFTKV